MEPCKHNWHFVGETTRLRCERCKQEVGPWATEHLTMAKMIEQPAPKDYRAFYDGKRWYSVEVEQPTQDAKQAVEAAVEQYAKTGNGRVLEATMRQIISNEALNKMAENARELGLDYEPPCKTGSQCTSKCPQCEQPAQQQDMPKIGCVNHDCDKCKAQQQEPVAVARVDDLERGGRVRALAMGLGLDAALYTSPQPAQPSKPLTDEEILDMARTFGAQPWPPGSCVAFARAIEAKLKENT